MTSHAIEFLDVRIRYEPGDPPVIDGATFSIDPGERVALIGLNGSGKTTLLMATVGLVHYEGNISVCGITLSRRTLREVRDKVGFLFNVPEDQLLFPKVIDDAAFGLLRNGAPADQAAGEARKFLAAFGVEHLAEAPLHHLSHGQKQRVSLAGALATKPPVLLLDEPSAGLDPPGKLALAGHLRGLSSAILVATHDLEFAASLCNRCIMLEMGRIVDERLDLDTIRHRWGLSRTP